jgi:hypothetical protein
MDCHSYDGKTSMEGTNPTLNLAEEISTFCPVRLYLANRRFDGLLDTLDSKGGSFYVLTDEELAQPGSPRGVLLQKENLVELAIGSSENELRIACKVRGMRIVGLRAPGGLGQAPPGRLHRLAVVTRASPLRKLKV